MTHHPRPVVIVTVESECYSLDIISNQEAAARIWDVSSAS